MLRAGSGVCQDVNGCVSCNAAPEEDCIEHLSKQNWKHLSLFGDVLFAYLAMQHLTMLVG